MKQHAEQKDREPQSDRRDDARDPQPQARPRRERFQQEEHLR
jgi:hypothetical protein